MIHSLTGSTDQPASTLIISQNRFLRKLSLSLSLSLSDYAEVKKVLVSERLKSSNTKDTVESVDKKGISISGSWPMMQTIPFMCKDEEACNLWSHTQVHHQELIKYDQLHTLRYNTTRNRFVAWIAFVSSGLMFMLSGCKANIESCNLIQGWQVIIPSGNSGFMS